MIRYILIFTTTAALMAGCGRYATHDPAGTQGDGKSSVSAPSAEQGKESKAPKK